QGFDVFRRESISRFTEFQNAALQFYQFRGDWQMESRLVNWSYRQFPDEIMRDYFRREVLALASFEVRAAAPAPQAATSLAGSRVDLKDEAGALYQDAATVTLGGRAKKQGDAFSAGYSSAAPGAPEPSKPDVSKVMPRKNLNETAFFFPQLVAGDDGTVRISFTMPEALTEWKFIGFAHDAKLRSGFLTDRVVTAKDLMVEPNPPRFVREGDAIELTVKVSNQTDQPQSGTVRLTFADAATLQSVDDALGNRANEKSFNVPAKQSRSFSWRIAIPDGMGFLTYKAVGATAQASDGEEGFLPVLSRRILVHESLPLPIRGKTTKDFEFTKLLDSGKSDTLRSQSLTVQMVSQPAWYAVMALPYLMEFPHECNEQVFSRLYANALARQIANSDPKIRRIFDLWKNTPALDSPMEKNQDLKSVLLEETPWVRQAAAESQSRHNVGLLFDGNRLDTETARTFQQLAERQLGDGLWPWFPGGRANEYITLYIVTGFGRLRNLGAGVDVSLAVKALGALDAWMEKNYRHILTLPDPERYIPSSTDALYLYARSFFLKDRPIAPEHRAAVDFFLQQSRKFWLQTNWRQSQAHLALGLQRFGDQEIPAAIMKSLKERSVTNEEMGMFWRDLELSWWWFRAPIETQAMMIEAFDEVAHDAQAVEDCKVWLLKQKQTQDWKTTKATADAVYGLLLRGNNLLSSDALVEVSLGGKTIEPGKVEAGTGFYEQKFVRGEIKPEMGRITVKKTDDGVSWGSVHWQYLEDMAKVTPHEGTPLKLKKTLFTKETTKQGPVLKPVTGPLAVGDELVVRIELRTDRDMEFVHLKDQRGSGTEPVNVLSGYRYQDGLGYYESTRDTASHFFIDYLPKGTYVFEYSTRIQLKGTYQTGIAEIQCMYAPEFNSHSGSIALEVK
ncbi:MAG TPA: alpha-2-macroglobulin family protein, partial [Candidatus Didemnitutus sp.]|nr:alpha-2-macroglobulin family protein [Candidatus Didemnitutus sp.]